MMLTRCPACQTVFRLRAEQLRARRGEVRCGHCFHPFNALEHLVETREAPPSTPQQTVEEATQATAPGPEARTTTEPVHAPTIATSLELEQQTPPSSEPGAQGPDSTVVLDFFDLGPAINSADVDPTPEPGLPEPAVPPVTPQAPADTASSALLNDLDFDIPTELGRDPHADGSARPGSSFIPRQQEPALDEIDFSSFFDVPTPPPAETRTEPLRPTVAPLAFPSLDRATEDLPSATQEPADKQAPFSLHPTPTDEIAAPAEVRLPGVIRSERRPAAADADRSDTPPAPTPIIDEKAAPQDASHAEPSARLHHTNNEVETDPLTLSLPPLTATAPDVQHLDRIYGKTGGRSNTQRTLWGLVLGLLAGCLLAQGIYLFRTDLTRALPGLRPLLVSACNALACEVPLPREADKIVIIASDLQSEPGRPGRFILHATVRNQADFPQEWPHLELTLTDGADTPVARRVLSPQEWIAPDKLSSAFAARGDITLRQPLSVTDLNPTGYRVYVFYP